MGFHSANDVITRNDGDTSRMTSSFTVSCNFSAEQNNTPIYIFLHGLLWSWLRCLPQDSKNSRVYHCANFLEEVPHTIYFTTT